MTSPAPLGPILHLVRARIRARAGERLLAIGAVAAAAALVAGLAGIAIISGEQSIHDLLARTSSGDQAIRITRFADSERDAAALDRQAREAVAAVEGFAGEPIRSVLFRRVRAPGVLFDVQLVGLDDPAVWTSLVEGRQPAACDGLACEAILLSDAPIDSSLARPITVGRLGVTVVGRATLESDLPVGRLDTSGGRPNPGDVLGLGDATPAALLVVRGVDALGGSAAVGTISRTWFWTAPLDLATIHGWTVADLRAGLSTAATRLAEPPGGHTVAGPIVALERELERVAGGSTRLIALGSLAVAVLLAFGTFAGLLARSEVGREAARLARVGATRRQQAAFVVLEPVGLAIVGGLLGTGFGVASIAILAGLNGLAPAVVLGALASPATLAPILLVVAGGASGLAIAAAPGFRPGPAARTGAVALVSAVAVLAWQLIAGAPAGSGSGAGAGGPGSVGTPASGPVLVVLPALAAFSVALTLLLVLPIALRALAARSAGLALPARLALLSVAREPGRPAATVTLLTLSVGLMAFAAGYGATVEQGTADQTAFQTAMDLRVTEGPTALTPTPTVLPFERYAGLPAGSRAWPISRLSASAPGDRPVTLIGLPPDALPELRGWRADFGPANLDAVASDLAVGGTWQLAGQVLAAGVDRLTVNLDVTGRALRVTGYVAALDGEVAAIPLGTLREGAQTLSAPLPADARGGVLVALGFANDQLIAGEYHQGELVRTTITLRGLPGLTPETPHQLELARVETALIRPPQATDGLILPALVDPVLAAEAARSADGVVLVRVAGALVRVRPIATATAFPTVADLGASFVVADLAPLRVALDADAPGLGRANEAWIATPDAATATAASAALRAAPFRSAQVQVRDHLAQARTNDPVARTLVWGILAAAAAGLALAALGLALEISTTLRDEGGEMADLEAQGLTPATLRRQVLARTLGLATAGTLSGLLAGIVVTALATGTLALTADAARPVPSLVVVVPWSILAGLAAGVGLGVIGLVNGLAARRDGRSAAWLAGRSG